MTLYVDSSALIKRYVAEDDSDRADAILLADPEWVTGHHAHVEIALAIHRRLGEAEQEAAVFAQAANVDRLLMMLRNMDPAKDNLADNEEIQVCTFNPPMRMHDTYYICTGIVPVLHDIAPQDCEAN